MVHNFNVLHSFMPNPPSPCWNDEELGAYVLPLLRITFRFFFNVFWCSQLHSMDLHFPTGVLA